MEIETSPRRVSLFKWVAERGFGTVLGITRSLMMGHPTSLTKLWAEAVKAAIHLCDRMPSSVVGREGPLKNRTDETLKRLAMNGFVAPSNASRNERAKVSSLPERKHTLSSGATLSIGPGDCGTLPKHLESRTRVKRRSVRSPPVTLLIQRRNMKKHPRLLSKFSQNELPRMTE